MEEQFSLFKTDPDPSPETWVCQRTVMLGSNHCITIGELVTIIDRYKDRWLNVDMIVMLHNSARVESMESFFIKHFYILSSGKGKNGNQKR